MILSNKHNRLLPGDRHQKKYLPDGTYSPPGFFLRPNTELVTRIHRAYKTFNYVDTVAEEKSVGLMPKLSATVAKGAAPNETAPLAAAQVARAALINRPVCISCNVKNDTFSDSITDATAPSVL